MASKETYPSALNNDSLKFCQDVSTGRSRLLHVHLDGKTILVLHFWHHAGLASGDVMGILMDIADNMPERSEFDYKFMQ